MSTRSNAVERACEIFGEIPELTQPYQFARYGEETQEYPYKLTKLDGEPGREKVVLEARGLPSSGLLGKSTEHLIRVEYQMPYRLEAKRVLSLHKSRSLVLVESGKISRNLNEVEISLGVSIESAFAPTKSQLLDPSWFDAIISIMPTTDDHNRSSLASACYTRRPRTPFEADFAYADYPEALKGIIERRDQGVGCYPRFRYRTTFYEAAFLYGMLVGVNSFKDDKSGFQTSQSWLTKVNTDEQTPLENTPFAAWVSHLPHKSQFGMGRLKLYRVNLDNQETWMLSIPEAIDKESFLASLQKASFADFLAKYPVLFEVEKPATEKKSFRTAFVTDFAR